MDNPCFKHSSCYVGYSQFSRCGSAPDSSAVRCALAIRFCYGWSGLLSQLNKSLTEWCLQVIIHTSEILLANAALVRVPSPGYPQSLTLTYRYGDAGRFSADVG
jgi:hypothetical protein